MCTVYWLETEGYLYVDQCFDSESSHPRGTDSCFVCPFSYAEPSGDTLERSCLRNMSTIQHCRVRYFQFWCVPFRLATHPAFADEAGSGEDLALRQLGIISDRLQVYVLLLHRLIQYQYARARYYHPNAGSESPSLSTYCMNYTDLPSVLPTI